ncbi:hypothetical protein GOV07_04950, partial [Candidatus Woesearchaeota archaeon]|nr:hypothetical protein [Candidatus Woesearchaeota archaeon]
MGAREDKTFLFLTIAVFIVTVGSIVLMVRPIVPTLPSPPNMLTGQAFAAGDPIHSGYAPPWDFASAELFYEVTQPSYTDLTGSDEVTVSITIDREDAFIYKRILYYDEQNTEWDQLGESGWTKDSYDAEITFTLDELSEDNYLLAYTCIYDADKQDKWDCGCKNPTDTVCRAYTIQHFKGPPVITPPSSDTACSVNADCTNSSKSYYDANKKYCRPVLGVCVECKNDAHCDAGKVCTNSVCVAPGTTGCTSDGDCSGSTPKCDVALGECFECLLDDD